MLGTKYLKRLWFTIALWAVWTTAFHADTIDFSSIALSYVGVATTIPYGIRLTDITDPDADNPFSFAPAGAVWSLNPISVASGFSTTFWFRMSEGTGYPDPGGGPPGADGFAFVVQNGGWILGRGNRALGVAAGGLGYMYLSNSLAIEFDTWKNTPYGDKDGNHIAVNTRGPSWNVPHHTYQDIVAEQGVRPQDYMEDPALYYQPVDRLLNDGLPQEVQIDYVPGSLSVYLNSQFLFSTPLQLDSLLDLPGGEAFVGFTAGTRWGYQNHDILFAEPIPEPATWLTILSGLTVALFCYRRQPH